MISYVLYLGYELWIVNECKLKSRCYRLIVDFKGLLLFFALGWKGGGGEWFFENSIIKTWKPQPLALLICFKFIYLFHLCIARRVFLSFLYVIIYFLLFVPANLQSPLWFPCSNVNECLCRTYSPFVFYILPDEGPDKLSLLVWSLLSSKTDCRWM